VRGLGTDSALTGYARSSLRLRFGFQPAIHDPMSPFRSDIWVAAFVRRHNDLGHMCVLERRGDPVAGQIFITVDHLDGTVSLFTPAPAAGRQDQDSADRVFERRFERVEPLKARERIAREINFDPDLWVVGLEMRGGDLGILVV